MLLLLLGSSKARIVWPAGGGSGELSCCAGILLGDSQHSKLDLSEFF